MLKFIHLKVGEKMIHESLKKDFSEIADTIPRQENSPAFPAPLPAGPDRGYTAGIPRRALRKTDKSV